tara:strand:- start:278 stop:403 length:126 start_codon:yes stop_codon:yes gene_type:complete
MFRRLAEWLRGMCGRVNEVENEPWFAYDQSFEFDWPRWEED